MELKRKKKGAFLYILSCLLIVPYGIETDKYNGWK